jgi:hypothetical protein
MGPAEAERFRAELEAGGRPRYRHVPYASVTANIDFGALAAQTIKQSRQVGTFSFMRALGALFEDDARTSGDAASFLLFDGEYASRLISHGYADARRVADRIEAL